MRNGWTSFRGQQLGVPLLFGGAVLVGTLVAFTLTSVGSGGGAPASPAAAGPVTTQAATTPSRPPTTGIQPPAATQSNSATPGKAKSGPSFLCIYPGVGGRHMISRLPGGVSPGNWAITCRATDGRPVTRVSASLFEEPQTHQVFKLQRTSGGNFYVRLTSRS